MSCTAEEYAYKIGDEGEDLIAILKVDGVPYDLTGIDGVVFRVRNSKGGDVEEYTCEVEDATAGKVKYTWDGDEITAAGLYFADFVLTRGATILTFPRGAQDPMRIVARERV